MTNPTGAPVPEPAVPPIYQTTTFRLTDEAYDDITSAEGLSATWYSRFSNPTVEAAAAAVARLEAPRSDDAVGTLLASGMAAIATTLVSLLRAGDRVVAAREMYGDTRDLFVRDLPALGIEVEWVDVADAAGWRAALGRGARLAYAETMSNPMLRLCDVPDVAAVARAAGALLVVDNTFASPYCVRPLEYGADIVVESATKFLNGHSDVTAGAVVTRPELAREVRRRVVTFGGCLDPHAAFLLHRGTRTFGVRLAAQCATAERLAVEAASLDGVLAVVHPSRADYPQRDVAERLMERDRYGAMLTLVLDGGDDRAGRFLRALRVGFEATSLGGVETLVSAPHNSSHFSLTPDERTAAGIRPGTVRFAIGLEPAEDLLADIENALKASA
jgi:cystathionine beta-lyase/cystathionine gamma-synthase